MCRPYGWVLGPKFSKQGSLFRPFVLKHGWVSRKWQKIVKMGSFPPKFIINQIDSLVNVGDNSTKIGNFSCK